MTYEYRCPDNHEFELFFKSFSEADVHSSSTLCQCGLTAERIWSAPLGFGLYGDPAGYDKPSTSKRFNTKTVSRKEGNRSAA